ncbi:MAG TPA: trypsin-like peptidase domain-containing protein, partial [Flavobacteriales bacterium]|nr:trypsin-like peptidase domain-containing protein [Flavobacteriales bacterium]
SVAMITVGGSGLCTGQLINNCADDGTPYFLTANHCTTGGGSNSWVFRFKWESPVCTPTTNAATNKTVSGSTLLINSGGSDVALLRLNTTPPASYQPWYTGWDKSGAIPTTQTCIHHPDGDIKKISFNNDPSDVQAFGSASCWHIPAWDDGTTEPGSSGSGLWDQNGRLIGQLFGGQAQCGPPASNNVNDYFGRFSVSYPLLTTWLGDCGSTHEGYPNDVGVAEVSTGELRIAPNPTTGTIVVSFPSTMRNGGRLAIYDALGHQVTTMNVTAGIERVTLDLEGRTEGIYLLDASAGSYHSVNRVVLTH